MEHKTALKRIWDLLVLERKEINAIYFFAIFSGLIQLTIPLGIQAIIGFVLGASMVTSIFVLILVVVAGVLIVGLMQINQMKIIEKIQQKIFVRYAFEFAELMPKFDLKQIDGYYLPEKVNRFFDTINLQKAVSKLLLDAPLATIQILFGLILLSFYHPFFIVFGFLLVATLWVILRFTSPKGLKTSLQESKYKYKVVAWFEEMARVIKTFKFSQGTHLNLKKTDENVFHYLNYRNQHFLVLMYQFKSLIAFKVAITLAMLSVGSYLLLNQQLNIGEFIAAEIVILTVISAVEKLIVCLDSLYDVATGLEKLATFTEIKTEKEGSISLNSSLTNIDVKIIDFSFEYNENHLSLEKINLHIPAGSLICIMGEDGAGKSTLLNVLSGSYREYQGSILFNNIPISNYKLESIRSKIGVFMASNDIFEGNVFENITMGHEEIKPEKIIELSEKLGIHQLIYHLTNGFETTIDADGKKQSSSIVKKILLLRALANEPSLLLLEEPWQGFDNDLKKTIKNFFLNKQTPATTFIVSNDLDFASKCDFVVEMQHGHAILKTNALK
jgi:ATP-binding cassette, subfamily B, bacterial